MPAAYQERPRGLLTDMSHTIDRLGIRTAGSEGAARSQRLERPASPIERLILAVPPARELRARIAHPFHLHAAP